MHKPSRFWSINIDRFLSSSEARRRYTYISNQFDSVNECCMPVERNAIENCILQIDLFNYMSQVLINAFHLLYN